MIDCPDCTTTHMGVACGSTYAQRLRSVRLDASVTPSRDKVRYYDDESLKDLFGGKSEAERREQLMEETKGIGAVSRADLAKLSDKQTEVFLGKDA